MFSKLASLSTFGIIGVAIILIACIPREEPDEEKVQYLQKVTDLPVILNENSGMIMWDNLIWYINDSGNEPVLYGYSMNSNTVVRTVRVTDVLNTDWEDITQDQDRIYIGDFGNNSGSRTDLRIAIIDKSDLLPDINSVSVSGVIEFSYEDQTDFTPAANATAYDCEAFVVVEDSLVLFTKDWLTSQTRLYTIPAKTGKYTAKFRNQWNVSGLVTAAAWLEQSDALYLAGYTPIIPFLCTVSGISLTDYTYDAIERSAFADFMGTQTEGLFVSPEDSVYISSESYAETPAALFKVVTAN